MSYDYISVANDTEILDAFNKILEKAIEGSNKPLALAMTETTVPHFLLVNMIKERCEKYYEIKDLVNKQIEDTRTAESFERGKTLLRF